jgi:hypothetical protein
LLRFIFFSANHVARGLVSVMLVVSSLGISALSSQILVMIIN